MIKLSWHGRPARGFHGRLGRVQADPGEVADAPARRLKPAILTLLLPLLISGCSVLPTAERTWVVVVDVTPSVEQSAEGNDPLTSETNAGAGSFVQRELDQARNLRADGLSTKYYLVSGTLDAKCAVEKLPKTVQEIGEQDKPNSDYVRCIREAIDNYGGSEKKPKLTVFGDFRYVSGSKTYKNWTPSPAAFDGRKMDGWDVELVCPNYLSGSGSGVEERAQQWEKCFKDMGAANVSISTTAH